MVDLMELIKDIDVMKATITDKREQAQALHDEIEALESDYANTLEELEIIMAGGLYE